ncbi:hypothetical protein [Arthrobacter agilis]|uniref:hypothetical protein n=1 Tax=Arthrobacter agilis TaxID=37921 RepID=UPI0027D7F2E9|nr:hypothetical protein [Arthrobacter agilis]
MQFQTASTAMTASSLTLGEVYLHYLNSGGFFDELELDAYLHGLIPLTREERDCIAGAVNELIDDLLAVGATGRPPRATYSGARLIRGTGRLDLHPRRLVG